MVEPQALAELSHRLRLRLAGEIHSDPYYRSLYSTDASNHLVQPLGVVIPRNDEDLFAVVETAAELGVPVLPRGGGTSLSGSALGAALILDCSQHLAQIHHIDPAAQLAEVGPGVVCTQLNLAAAQHGLVYGPDPASADRATTGGMIGTNATGAHSIQYGMTADHVVSLDVILADGSPARLEDIGLDQARAAARTNSLEGRIYARALDLRLRYAKAVEEGWPRTWRRSSGYNLNYLTGFTPDRPAAWYGDPGPYPPQNEFNLAPLICGSEGTLAIVRRAQLRLVRKPASTALLVLGFAGVAEACDFTSAVLETEPAAVELIPRTLIQRARAVPLYSRKLSFVEGDPAALLVVEYAGDSPAEAVARAQALASHGRVLSGPLEQADLWAVRKAGLGLLMSVPGEAKPITFMEDVAVPVAQLGAYVREVDRILAAHDTYGEWYAHASAGCLHLRPLINLKSEAGIRQMRAIAEAVVELALSMRGAISGEHGDGLSHTEFNERLFGPVLLGAFRELKQAFDPKGILNPGKVVPDSPPSPMLDSQLRFGPAYRTSAPATIFAFRKEGGFAKAIEACTGVGICRKADGVMCPSFQATRMEMHSTRGRANALRAVISGGLPQSALTGDEIFGILDLCLECKGCKSECPTQVDMARMKAEVLNWYQQEHGIPLRSRLFGEIAAFMRLAQPAAGLANPLVRSKPFRWAMETGLGVARQRVLPPLARRTFSRQFNRTAGRTGGDPVILFVDTFTELNHPELGHAAVRVLEAAGCQVLLATGQGCCGRTMVSKGLLGKARACALHNVEALSIYARQGIPIVGLEPSCLLMLRDEYLDLLPGDEDAIAIAGTAKLIEEFLTEAREAGSSRLASLQLSPKPGRLLLHNHCHSKALVGSSPALALLRAIRTEVEEIPSGCCGMAGSFGYEAEHYALSMQIGELKLFPQIRSETEKFPEARIAAPGMSCRAQIRDGTGAMADHPVTMLAEALQA